MNTMNNIRWDDLVFEKRNQSYGAYVLRKMYPNRVTLSFGFAMAVVVTLLASPTIKAMFGGDIIEPIIKEKKVNVIDDVIVPPVTITPPPPVDIAPPKETKYVPPKLTEEQVDTTTPTMDELKAVDVSDQTLDGSETFIEAQAAIEPVVETVDVNKIWTIVEQQPEFVGGYQEMMKYIAKNTKYPSSARRMNVEGSVFISFVVNEDGTIDAVQALKGIQGRL
ncbi:MAG: energy transducer TonB [Bacteroidota bacterium]